MTMLGSIGGLALVALMLTIAIRAAAIPENVGTWAWLRCTIRGWHEPRRQPLGGQRCQRCGMAGADLADLGFEGGAYITFPRRVFARDRVEVVRTSAWDRGARGW